MSLPLRPIGSTGGSIPVIGLGGHEFSVTGRIRGLHDDVAAALTPGRILPAFGGPVRRALVASALARGIRLFDVTIDSEKEALGRVLADLGAPEDVLIQTRPEGFMYSYDPGNRAFLDREKLVAEVSRIRELLRRPRIDILNVGLSAAALEAPGYLEQLGATLDALKQAGLVSRVACDTFSGEDTYLRLIRSGLFDILYVIYSPLADGAARRLLPEAAVRGMGVLVKEPFLKGALFRAAAEVPGSDPTIVAGATLRWIIRRPEVTSVVIGVRDAPELVADLASFEGGPAADDDELLGRIAVSSVGSAQRATREHQFVQGIDPFASLR